MTELVVPERNSRTGTLSSNKMMVPMQKGVMENIFVILYCL